MYDLEIKNAIIIDGLGKEPYSGNLYVKDGKIIAITNGVSFDADISIDATGKVVTPGFIDLHNSLPPKKSVNMLWTFGIRVEPPTKTISSIQLLEIFESCITFSTGSNVCLNKFSQNHIHKTLLSYVF